MTTATENLAIKRAEYIQSQIVGQDIDNRLAAALAETAEMALHREQLRKQWDSAAPSLHRIYTLVGEINIQSVANMIDTLSRWDRMDTADGIPERPYKIILTSQGGEVIAGFQAYSYMRGLGERRKLTVVASGLCASMATVLHQAASDGERVIEPGCTYLLHEVSGSIGGRLDSITDTGKWLEEINSSMHKIFAERSHKTVEEIKAEVNRRERYMNADEVVEWGLADRKEYNQGG